MQPLVGGDGRGAHKVENQAGDEEKGVGLKNENVCARKGYFALPRWLCECVCV